MTRLTKEIRKIICKNALSQSPIKQEMAVIKQKLEQLGLEIYKDNVTSEQNEEANKIQKRIEELPFCCSFGVFNLRTYISCSFGGMCDYVALPDSGEFYELPRINYDAEHEFSKRFNSLDQKKGELLEQLDNIKQEIMAVLNSCNTLKKLLEVWPEASNFLDGIEVITSKTGLPAVMVADLNKKLGINSD